MSRIIGLIAAIAYYYVQLVGSENDGRKIIDSAYFEAPHSAESGFHAVGSINATYSGSEYFAYQYAVGVGTRDISLTWSGSSFTMYGSDFGACGGASISANNLD